nr:uncharacterized protein LOC4331539 isoform X3 [Oryza sativa Japonica Group]
MELVKTCICEPTYWNWLWLVVMWKVVNNSDQDYSHLPELDLSVMLNQGTLHQSQDQLLINHTSPVRYHRCLWSRGLRTMVETSTDLEGTLDQVSGIFSLWVDRAKWTVQGGTTIGKDPTVLSRIQLLLLGTLLCS